MKSSVTYSKLSTLCKVQNGYAFDSKLFTSDSNDMPLVRIRDIKTGQTETFYKGNYSQEYVLHNGDYIIGMDGEFNITEWQGGDALLNQRVCRIIVSSNKLLPKYVLYFLPIPLRKIEDETPFVTVKHLSSKKLNDIIIPVPSIEEQQHIVDELDLLTGIIDKKNAQLRDLDALAQSIFYEMFGDPYTNIHNWPTAFLESMVTEGCSISYGIVQPGDGEVDGVPIVRPVDLLGTFVHNKNLKKTTKEISDSYKRTILKGNELLLCVRGTTGIVSLAANDLGGCNVSRGITPLEFNNENSRWFMYYQFKTAAVQGTISELTHGIALKGINMADVRKLTMIQPPYHLQKEFEDKVMSIDAQKERIIASLQDLNSLLQSKMDGYFSE